ncbi:hypothetical protein, partial [Cyclobacterium amurskyense]|uniref:hypothetical protein n=1 Tax=Cyclobacterium amurskyense TaxID=320787 RepID=UPI0030DA5645
CDCNTSRKHGTGYHESYNPGSIVSMKRHLRSLISLEKVWDFHLREYLKVKLISMLREYLQKKFMLNSNYPM